MVQYELVQIMKITVIFHTTRDSKAIYIEVSELITYLCPLPIMVNLIVAFKTTRISLI